MARKDVDIYYKQITDQYVAMLDAVKDFEKASMNTMMPPEKIEQLNRMVEVVKQNYMRWSYMMYLLDLPNRDSKKGKFNCINKKRLAQISKEDTIESVKDENNCAIKNIKSL